MNDETTRVEVALIDGRIITFYSESSYEIHDGVFVWGDVLIDGQSVDYYSIPERQVREVKEFTP